MLHENPAESSAGLGSNKTPSLRGIYSNMDTELLKGRLQKYATKEDLIFFSLILLVTLLALSSLLQANVLYIDDNGRVLHGYGWGLNGRPLATGIMRFLSGGAFIVDLSPATQIIAAGLMSFAAYVLVRCLLDGKRSVPTFLAAILVTLNPYFLQVYSYRYDSLPYSTGFLLSVMAAFYLTQNLEAGPGRTNLKSKLRVVLAPAALLIGSLSIYQPATNLFFIAIAGAILVRTQSHNFDAGSLRTARIILIRSALAVVLAMALYWAMLRYLVNIDEYAQGKAAVDIANALTIIFANLQLTWDLVWEDWRQNFLGIAFVGIALCAFARLGYEVIFSLRTVRAVSLPNRSSVWLLFFQLGGIAAICLFSTIGLALINSDPILQPRGFMSFGAAFAVLLTYGIAPLQALMGGGRKRVIGVLVFMPVAWLAGFALAYGNATLFQDRYNKSVASFITKDVIALSDGELEANIAFQGSPGFAPAIAPDLISNFPLVSRLVKIYPSNNRGWGYKFLEVAGLDIFTTESGHCYSLDQTDAEVWTKNGFYRVGRRQDCLVFDFLGPDRGR